MKYLLTLFLAIMLTNSFNTMGNKNKSLSDLLSDIDNQTPQELKSEKSDDSSNTKEAVEAEDTTNLADDTDEETNKETVTEKENADDNQDDEQAREEAAFPNTKSKKSNKNKEEITKKDKEYENNFEEIEKEEETDTDTDTDKDLAEFEKNPNEKSSEDKVIRTEKNSSKQPNPVLRFKEESSKLMTNYMMGSATSKFLANFGNTVEFKKLNIMNSDWMTITSKAFKKIKLHPKIPLPTGQMIEYEVDSRNRLINSMYGTLKGKVKGFKRASDFTIRHFFFRLTKNYIYWANTEKSNVILNRIYIKSLGNIVNLNDDKNCFEITDVDGNKYKLCARKKESVLVWICVMKRSIKGEDVKKCTDKKFRMAKFKPRRMLRRKLKQPFIIIPSPQRYCNAGWNYHENGKDWECLCLEGKEQSPIDLPEPNTAILSPVSPVFDYSGVDPVKKTLANGQEDHSYKLKIKHKDNALKVTTKNNMEFGRLVTIDGAVYKADEIIFHTPSEHTLNGRKYPMEMQVIHSAKTKGDFGKKAVLSILLEGKPARYNKFIDSLEFFNLPNPHDKFKYIHNRLFIPNILLKSKEEELSIFRPFSFYTYSGSLTAPPCNENTIHFVASKPVEVSMTAIDMFKEALRMPDFEDSMGNMILTKDVPLNNNRHTQALNGRPVFHYDHKTFASPLFKKKKEESSLDPYKKGHFEKQQKEITNIFYVEGNKPSGLPGALLVDKDE